MNAEKKKLSLAGIRQEYANQALSEKESLPDALQQFGLWMQQAIDSQVIEPTAMVLSTVSADNQPSARVVLLKALDTGFVFFTNYESRKGQELLQNNKAAITFFWPQLERQVRIEGTVEKVSDAESEEYFLSRPRGSQIGAWASPQSKPISSREALEQIVEDLENKFSGTEKINRPAHWGGYRLMPNKVEFWQGRPGRLHDRLLYTASNGTWQTQRLAP